MSLNINIRTFCRLRSDKLFERMFLAGRSSTSARYVPKKEIRLLDDLQISLLSSSHI